MRFERSVFVLALACLAAVAQAQEFAADHIFVGCTDDDSRTARVIEFEADGTYVRTIDLETDLSYRATYGVAFGPDGLLYAADNGSDKVFQVAADGSSAVWFEGDPALEDSDGATFGPRGDLWVGSRDTEKLVRIDPDKNLTEFPLPAGYSSEPAVMNFTPSGRRLLTSSGSARIDVVDGLGNYSQTFGVAEIDDYPATLLELPEGQLIVADYDGGSLERFRADGGHIETIGDPAFLGPFGLARQSNGTILIADYDAGQLHLFRLGAGVTASVGHADMSDPAHVAVAPYVFVTKLKALTAAPQDAAKKLTEKPVIVSIQPGDGTVMVSFEEVGDIGDRYGARFVFRGHLARRAGDTKRAILHASLPGGNAEEGVGSVALELKGAQEADGRFSIQKFKGTLTLTWGGDSMIASFKGVKRLN